MRILSGASESHRVSLAGEMPRLTAHGLQLVATAELLECGPGCQGTIAPCIVTTASHNRPNFAPFHVRSGSTHVDYCKDAIAEVHQRPHRCVHVTRLLPRL